MSKISSNFLTMFALIQQEVSKGFILYMCLLKYYIYMSLRCFKIYIPYLIYIQSTNCHTFDETIYEAKLKENSPPGTFVTPMIANDLDSPKNADITYGNIDYYFT